MSSLQLKVSQRSPKSEEEKATFEGTVSVPGLRPAKLTRKDGTTQFATKTAVTNAAKRLASSLGFTGVENTTQSETKKAAKKSSTKK